MVPWIIFLCVILGCSGISRGEVVPWEFKGMSLTNGKYCPEVRFGTPEADLSQENLYETGTSSVAIIVTHFQSNINSTGPIVPFGDKTATDGEVRAAIRKAHALGQTVMLKPHVDLSSDPGSWRGEIGQYFDSGPDPVDKWSAWFSSYEKFISHYAKLAAEERVAVFSLGCELIATSPQEFHWRHIAKVVRETFQEGKLTYSANWGGEETNKTWWDAVDIIGVDAYYPLCPFEKDPSLRDLVAFWEKIVYKGVANGVNGGYMSTSLQNLTFFWNRPLMFTEIGYCSGQCTKGPEINLAKQTLSSQSVFDALANVPWFKGVFWWNWASDPAFGGETNATQGANCCTPQWKPMQDVITQAYGGRGAFHRPRYPAKCTCIL